MRQLTSVFLLAFVFLNVLGQENTQKDYFIYLYNGKLIKSYSIDYKQSFLKLPYFEVDSIKYSEHSVKFYRNQSGFYANTAKNTFSGTTSFATCLSEGEINLFNDVKTHYNAGQYNAATGSFSGGGASSSSKLYYNSGFEDLKKASFKNMEEELRGNPECMLHLEKYKKAGYTSASLYAAGIITIAASIINLYNNTSNLPDGVDYNVTPNLLAAVAGTGSCWIGYYIYLDRSKHLKKAVDIYNKKL